MRLPGLLAVFSALAAVLPGTEAFPTFLPCERGFVPGNVIMAGPAIRDTNRSAVFLRDGVEVDCGGTYVPGEILVAQLSSFKGNEHFLMEIVGGTFVADGGCRGERFWCGGTRCGKSVDEGQALVAPMDGSELELTIGWTNYWGIVHFTETCVLSSATPTSYPTWVEQEERMLIENETMMPSMMMMLHDDMNMTDDVNGTNTTNTSMPTMYPTSMEMEYRMLIDFNDTNATLAPTMIVLDDDNSTNTTNMSMPTAVPTWLEYEEARLLIENMTMAPSMMMMLDGSPTMNGTMNGTMNDTMPNMTR